MSLFLLNDSSLDEGEGLGSVLDLAKCFVCSNRIVNFIYTLTIHVTGVKKRLCGAG